jgi:hypothetical protein
MILICISEWGRVGWWAVPIFKIELEMTSKYSTAKVFLFRNLRVLCLNHGPSSPKPRAVLNCRSSMKCWLIKNTRCLAGHCPLRFWHNVPQAHVTTTGNLWSQFLSLVLASRALLSVASERMKYLECIAHSCPFCTFVPNNPRRFSAFCTLVPFERIENYKYHEDMLLDAPKS